MIKKRYIALIIVLVIFTSIYLLFNTSDFDEAYRKGTQDYDLSGCEKLSKFRYIVLKEPFLFYGGSTYNIKNQRDACLDQVNNQFLVNRQNLKQFLEAVRLNQPEMCPYTGGYYCENEIKEKYKETSVCQYYFIDDYVNDDYFRNTYVFECQGYLVALEKQSLDYCEQFEGVEKNYCYFVIAREYNKIRQNKQQILVTHQTKELKRYYLPQPEIPNICDKFEDLALKNSCDSVFDKFESWDTPTLELKYE